MSWENKDFYYNLLEKGKIKEEDREPEIEPFRFLVNAFDELSTCRGGMSGNQGIPFSAIYDYSKAFEVEDFEEFLYYMRVLDKIYLKHIENKKPTPGSNNDNGSNKNGNNKSR